MARALELVGERWTLLIVRDLLVGPRRYTDLRTGLPRIPTNILSARLRELERNGIVRRRLLSPASTVVVYELTAIGTDLEEAIAALGRWGARSLGPPGADEVVTNDSMVMALRSTFRPTAAAGERVSYELRLGDVVVNAEVIDETLHVSAGPRPNADLLIEAGPRLRDLMAQELPPEEAIADGHVRVNGDPALLATFAEIFQIPKGSDDSFP